MKNYDVAAYVWPAYTGDELRSRIFWEEGIGEWQTVKNAKPKSSGYTWDRKPVWGYVNEADPYVMSMEIEAAVSHGVNVFIYDWYWYDNRPFLENCLNDGFLKAPNSHKMKFYLMWANHDANTLWDMRNSDNVNTTIWSAKADRQQFEVIGKRWIEKYFNLENYYKIDNKPVLCIYHLRNMIEGLGGVENCADAMKWLDDEAKKYGFDGVHFQVTRWKGFTENPTGVDVGAQKTSAEVLGKLGVSSVTNYQYVDMTDINRNYEEILPDIEKEWEIIYSEYNIPYFPHVSVGWDNNPRYHNLQSGIIKNNTPENIEKAMLAAKNFADKTGVNLITVNSWNEWTETSYLQPDNLYGYGYLEAIKKVFGNLT